MTIKFEIPSNEPIVLNRIGEALRKIAADLDPSVISETVKEVITPTKQDDAFAAVATNNGPFYWSHPESESTGAVTTLQELDVILNSDPLAQQISEDEHNHLCEEGYDATGAAPLVTKNVETATDQDGSTKSTGVSVTAGAELDSDGLPWDKRIHSSAKSQNNDDTWKIQRKPKNKDAGEWASFIGLVRTELRELMSVPVTPATDPVPPATDPVPPATDPVPPATDPVPPVTPPADPVPPVTPPADPMTFGQLMKFITSNRTALTKEVVDAVLECHGIAKLPLLAANPALIPQIHADLADMV